MLIMLSSKQSWWLAMGEAFAAIGKLYLTSNMTEEQLRQYIYDSLKPKYESYFLPDQDGDVVMLGKEGYELVTKIGWDAYDEYCKGVSGIDRLAEKKR